MQVNIEPQQLCNSLHVAMVTLVYTELLSICHLDYQLLFCSSMYILLSVYEG